MGGGVTTKLTDDRETALRVGYAATDWSTPVSFEQYADALKDWRVQAILRDDEIIGAVFKKDGEVHVSILPPWRRKWATRGIIKQIFDAADRTTVTSGHEHYMFDILQRLGMSQIGQNTFALKGV
jgi:hypothetical protein